MKYRIKQIALISCLLSCVPTALSQVAFEGDPEDIRWFLQQLSEARQVSDEFNKLYLEFEALGGQHNNWWPKPTIRLVRSKVVRGIFANPKYVRRIQLSPYSKGALIPPTPLAKFRGERQIVVECPSDLFTPPCTKSVDVGSSQGEWVYLEITGRMLVFDMEDLEKLPNFELSNDVWVLSDGAPNWMLSLEATIAHEIGEHYDGLVHGFCSYSCKCKSGDDIHDNHVAGKRAENAVRRGFGQKGFRDLKCGDTLAGAEVHLNENTAKVVVEGDKVIGVTWD